MSSISSLDNYRMTDQDIDGTDSHFLLYLPVAAPSGIDSGAHHQGLFPRQIGDAGISFGVAEHDPGCVTSPVFGTRTTTSIVSSIAARCCRRARYYAASTNTNYSFFAQANYDLTEKLQPDRRRAAQSAGDRL